MNIDTKPPVKKATVTVTMDDALLKQARAKAKTANRSLSNYLEWLLRQLYVKESEGE